ncbi:aspartate carbamoyltransferase [Candidatus Peregrinibacteria bacterium HGW-Peregrinibacteria-1]|jgi:aspartate carbamoyltransferase|nr:MAG: aspartate carbamoyltransferase [Candidatus Peregrinibacteria bacterium HGW-Peregrinibacteria-1]
MQNYEKHILTTRQFDRASLILLFEEALEMERVLAGGGNDLLKGRILASLFFEPSTRTRFSFETAMLRLGGSVISNYSMATTSSVQKKETLFDTGKVVSRFADVIVMRHPEVGSVAELARGSRVPVINGGDGPAEHPSQALLDLYTIWKERKSLDGVVIGMVGDLKNGRVPHSQCDLLKHFDCSFVFVAPEALAMPRGIVEELRESGHEVRETEDFGEAIGEMDVIGMTRVQEERFESKEEYAKYAGVYVLGKGEMGRARTGAIVLHPLPRVDEISPEIDEDPRCRYFEQVSNGVAIRMALLARVLG